jgi:hypothetical protein
MFIHPSIRSEIARQFQLDTLDSAERRRIERELPTGRAAGSAPSPLGPRRLAAGDCRTREASA